MHHLGRRTMMVPRCNDRFHNICNRRCPLSHSVCDKTLPQNIFCPAKLPYWSPQSKQVSSVLENIRVSLVIAKFEHLLLTRCGQLFQLTTFLLKGGKIYQKLIATLIVSIKKHCVNEAHCVPAINKLESR